MFQFAIVSALFLVSSVFAEAPLPEKNDGPVKVEVLPTEKLLAHPLFTQFNYRKLNAPYQVVAPVAPVAPLAPISFVNQVPIRRTYLSQYNGVPYQSYNFIPLTYRYPTNQYLFQNYLQHPIVRRDQGSQPAASVAGSNVLTLEPGTRVDLRDDHGQYSHG